MTKKVTKATYHNMHGSAMQYYGRLRFPMGKCDFGPPPHRNSLTDRYKILRNDNLSEITRCAKNDNKWFSGVCSPYT
jgi:hypothetical protein